MSKIIKDEIFKSLVANAFDFMQKALNEFENYPKFSVINFYSAVELFLKARLLSEHWTLILTKVDTANVEDFLKGDFYSVTLKDAAKRLKEVVGDGLSPQQITCFTNLGDHRNRIVHFFHVGHQGNKAELEKIVMELCKSWYHLNKLLSEQWNDSFVGYQKEIKKFSKRIHKYQQFLKAKFENLKPEIAKAKASGTPIHKCPSCGFKALKEDLIDFQCMVCGLFKVGITMNCPDCGQKSTLLDEPYHSCTKCKHKFTPENVKDFISEAKAFKNDAHILGAHCAECEGYETIVPVADDKWLCTNCFAVFNRDDIGTCDYCHEYSTGDLEDSFFLGCAICEGKSFCDKDD